MSPLDSTACLGWLFSITKLFSQSSYTLHKTSHDKDAPSSVDFVLLAAEMIPLYIPAHSSLQRRTEWTTSVRAFQYPLSATAGCLSQLLHLRNRKKKGDLPALICVRVVPTVLLKRISSDILHRPTLVS